MLVRTMKPFGAAVVFLAVINLLTESSTANVTDATSSQTPDLHKSNTALTSTPFISNSPTGTGNVQSSFTTVPTVITEDGPSTRTSQKPPITTVSSPTENLIDNATDVMNNMHVTGSTAPPPHDKMSTATPIKEKHPETTSASFQEHPSIGEKATSESPQVASKEASTRPSAEPKTKPTIDDNDPSNIDNNDKKTSNGDVKKLSATSNKEIKIGASCVAVVIAIFAIVVIYKICQKKPPAPENAEMKASAEKENVTLVSVKTESPNSDTKRTSSNQMEGIEC